MTRRPGWTAKQTSPIGTIRTERAEFAEPQKDAIAGRRHRLLVVSSHAVPYAEPLHQRLAQHPKLDVQVVHCLRGPIKDFEFGRTIPADNSAANRYPTVQLPNSSLKPGLGSFFGLMNFRLWGLIRKGNFDAVAVCGYAYLSFWIAFFAAKSIKIPILISTDATQLQHPRGGWWWKRWIKPAVVRFIYGRLADIVLVPSTAGLRFLERLGIPGERLVLTPFVADNAYFAKRATPAARKLIRQRLAIPEQAFVILYCGKLVRWKRPADLLHAFASLVDRCAHTAGSAYLLFAGDGALRRDLEAQAHAMNLTDQVRFLGFANYAELPEVYAASDLLVLPSEHEAWGVVVNEAMACGVPAVVSDRVGARVDLVISGETGDFFPMADVAALSAILSRRFENHEETRKMGAAARRRIASWSYAENVQGWIRALERIKRSESGSAANLSQDVPAACPPKASRARQQAEISTKRSSA